MLRKVTKTSNQLKSLVIKLHSSSSFTEKYSENLIGQYWASQPSHYISPFSTSSHLLSGYIYTWPLHSGWQGISTLNNKNTYYFVFVVITGLRMVVPFVCCKVLVMSSVQERSSFIFSYTFKPLQIYISFYVI